MTTHTDTHTTSRNRGRDRGYSFAELLVTVVLIGVLATIVTATVRNVTAEAAGTGCRADAEQMTMAATSFMEVNRADAIPPTGDDGDRYERTLVEAGYLRAPSEFHQLDAVGVIVPQEDSPC